MSEKPKRGFAALDPERRRAIARLGDLTAQKQGVAHRYTKEEAVVAGAKGVARQRALRAAREQAGAHGGQEHAEGE